MSAQGQAFVILADRYKHEASSTYKGKDTVAWVSWILTKLSELFMPS
jgi:hypothetical protein